MRPNLRVTVSLEGCFSAVALEYSIVFRANSAAVLACAFLEREPTALGIRELPYETATTYVETLVAIFDVPDRQIACRSTSFYDAEVSWNLRGKRSTVRATAPEISEAESPPEPWARKVWVMSAEFLREYFPSNNVWEYVGGDG